MKCIRCGSKTKSTRGAHRYAESGLTNVTLLNVETRQCPECGERELVIPRIDALHRAIARAIAQRQSRLTPEEIRFLRKWLGFSMTDFALVMGVRTETISRWESKDAGYQMPPTAERLLRLVVANQEPVAQYPLDLFKLQPKLKPQPLKFKAPNWERAA